jgi:hypothetical protein
VIVANLILGTVDLYFCLVLYSHYTELSPLPQELIMIELERLENAEKAEAKGHQEIPNGQQKSGIIYNLEDLNQEENLQTSDPEAGNMENNSPQLVMTPGGTIELDYFKPE